jgi:hypothetical protein
MKNNLNSNLLSKLNSQWQGFIDFMADGVADVGLERGSLVDKYLNELVNTNNPSNARAIESVVKARVINELLHFTPIDNLEQILKYGFIPDSSRDDGNKHCYCMSISWPNYKMFDVKRREMGGDWVVIKINPKAVINNECFFYKTNAGSYLGRKVGAGGIEDMFFDQKFREQLDIPDSFTTDPQAEVQSESRIPVEWIDEIHVREANSTSRYVRMLLKNANLLDKIKIVVDRRYFDKRKDYKYWQRLVA